MTYAIGTASRGNLAGVHPDMVRVVERAIQITKVDFKVIEGVRSKEKCWENWGKGRSAAACASIGIPAKYAQPTAGKVTWLLNPLNSKHTVQKDGYGHAVDLLAAPYDWKDMAPFNAVAQAMLQAAKELGVHIRWGRDWDEDGKAGEKGETDGPHFELVS